MGRAPCCEKVGLKKGRWTGEEDEKLANYIKANGEGSWRSLPKNAGLLRCGKSCRLRWINYLRADLKRGNISAEEEETIIKLHSSLGNRWSLIAAALPGRTDNEIKNYWNSHLSRRIHSFRRIVGDGPPMIMDLGRIVGMGRKPRGGRTSRSAEKKKNVVDAPIANDRHGTVGAGLPSHLGQSEPANGGGTSTVTAIQPACGLPQCESAVHPPITFLGHEEQLGSNELLDLWETTEEMGSGLFCPSGEMGDGFLVVSEESPGWGFPEEMECGGWSAMCSPSYEGELGATMSSSSKGEERDGAPRPASSGLKELVAAGVVEGVEAAGVANIGQSSVERDSAAEGWMDMELVEMAARLWDETREACPWQCEDAGNGELELGRLGIEGSTYEEGALDSWFLSDFL